MALKKKKSVVLLWVGQKRFPLKLRPCLGAGSGLALAGVGTQGCIPRQLVGSLAGSWDSAVVGKTLSARSSPSPLWSQRCGAGAQDRPAQSVGGAPQPRGVEGTHQVTNLWALPVGARPF